MNEMNPIEEALGLNVITKDLVSYAKKVREILKRKRRKTRKAKSETNVSEIETKFRIAFGYGGLLTKALSLKEFTARDLAFISKTDEAVVRKWIEEAISYELIIPSAEKYMIDRDKVKEFLEKLGYEIIDFASRI